MKSATNPARAQAEVSTALPGRRGIPLVRLAWSICLLAAAFFAVGILIDATPSHGRPGFDLAAVASVAFMSFPLVGAFIVTRRPRNAVGWMLCVTGCPSP